MKDNMDEILKQALAPDEEPDIRLNRQILCQAKERKKIMKKRTKMPTAAAAAACILLCSSLTGFAAWKYLSPSQIAEELKDQNLAEAFTGEDAISVNETQEFADYKVTFLGAAVGKNISGFLTEEDRGQIQNDILYAAVAIEHTDGTPMPDTSDDTYGNESFLVSPYIGGLDPSIYNIISMAGGYTDIVRDGIQYRLTEVTSLEMFADNDLYIGVSSGTFYNKDAYSYDDATGEMARNETYDGVNALFTLPLDASKADPKAAAAYLEEFKASWDSQSGSAGQDAADMEVDAWIAMVSADMENIGKYAAPVESSTQRITPDKDGNFSYQLNPGNAGNANVAETFGNAPGGTSVINGYSYSDGLADLSVEVFTLNEDGTVTFEIYMPILD